MRSAPATQPAAREPPGKRIQLAWCRASHGWLCELALGAAAPGTRIARARAAFADSAHGPLWPFRDIFIMYMSSVAETLTLTLTLALSVT